MLRYYRNTECYKFNLTSILGEILPLHYSSKCTNKSNKIIELDVIFK